MKALLICANPNETLFAPLGLDPWLLPVAGKAVVEYQLETLGQLGIQEIRLIGANPVIEARYGTGESLGLKLSYAPLPMQTTLQSLLRHNLGFVAGQSLLLLQGLNLIAPLHATHCLRLTYPVRLGDGLTGLTPQAIAAALKGDFTEADFAGLALQACCESRPLVSLKSYLQANLELSEAWSKCVSLPAYGRRDGFLCGSKLNLAKNLVCIGHGLIGSYSVIQPEVELQNAYLNRGVVVARGTHIRRSVILDGTWIGPQLTAVRKILHVLAQRSDRDAGLIML